MSDNFFKIKNGIALGNLTADPANPGEGDFYYNITLKQFRSYVNGAWGPMGSAGNADQNTENLKNQLVDSPYQLVTPNIFSTDAATKLDGSSTGAYNAGTKTFNYTSTGQKLVSTQMADSTEFLTLSLDISEIDLSVFWTSGFVDTAAIYEVSRDGGVTYQTVSMARVGQGTLSYYGNLKFSSSETVATNTTSNTSDELNATTGQILAQQFLTTSDEVTVRSAVLNLVKLGSPTGNVQVAIYSNSAGNPNAQLAISSSYSAVGLITGDNTFVIPDVTLAPGTYYVALLSDATYKSGFVTGVTSIKWSIDNTISGGGFREYTGSVWTGISARAKYTVYGQYYNSAYFNATVNSSLALNITTQQAQAQLVTTTQAAILTRIKLYTNKTDSPDGYFKIQLVRDNAGTPSTSSADILVESALIAMSTVTSGASTIDVDIPRTALAAGTYHVVVSTDASYKATWATGTKELNLQYNNAAGTGYSIYNGTAWSNSASKTMGYAVYGSYIDLRVKITSSVSSAKLDGYGIFYNIQANVVGGIKKVDRRDFFAVADNTSTFTLSWVPDPDLLRVEYVQSGQVFVYPSFNISGQVITFPVNTFNNGGTETAVTLMFKQIDGTSFNNSDSNAALLAANHLGAATGTDYSSPGAGIFLRRPDGTLREIALDNNDNIVILSV